MTGHTHTLADWCAFLSLGVAGHAALSTVYFLAVDADLCDFDPRPAVARVVESGRFDALLIAVANARFDAREAVADARVFARLTLRDAVITASALLMLCSPAAPEATS